MAEIIKLNTKRVDKVLAFKARAAQGNEAVTIADMDMFGVVGGDFWGDGITKENFAQVVAEIPKSVTTVNLRMSSPGGDVFDGRAIANMIHQHPAAFHVNIVAEASSIASIIALAGDRVHMAEGSVMLVHKCYAFCIGNADEMTALARDLAVIDESFVQTYMNRTGMNSDAVLALMKENRYMSAQEAKSRGFVDSIEEPAARATAEAMKIAALADDADLRRKLHLPPLPTSQRPRRAAALAALSRGLV